MVRHVNGIIRGTRVELDRPIADLPDGSAVSLDVRLRDSGEASAKARIRDLCGVWADDPTIEPVFREIEDARRLTTGRPVNLDDPS